MVSRKDEFHRYDCVHDRSAPWRAKIVFAAAQSTRIGGGLPVVAG